jgi:hypothetical protein
MKTIKINSRNSIPNNFTGIAKYLDGSKEWYKEGKFHREDGPAIEFTNETKHWYKEGKLHRINGPAIELPDGTKFWFIEGNLYVPEKLSNLIDCYVYLGKEKGQYDLEWLKFLTEEGIQVFPIISGMEDYKNFKEIFKQLEGIENN